VLRYGCTNRERHKAAHDRHLAEGRRLLRDLETSPDGHASRMYDWWKGWSVAHVVAEDIEFGLFLKAVSASGA